MCDNEMVAECKNTIGSYNCSCKPEYTGDGFNCTGMFSYHNHTIHEDGINIGIHAL